MTASPACPSCGAAGPFEFVDVVMAPVCACGHVFEDDAHGLTAASDFATEMGYGYNASRQGPNYDTLVAMRRLGFAGAASDENRRQNRELYDSTQLTQAKRFLRLLIVRLTQYTSAHPLFERILGLFQQLRTASLALEYRQAGEKGAVLQGDMSYLPAATPRLTWGLQSQAALAACTYAIFREDDAIRSHSRAEARNYSMHLIASCGESPFRRVRRWYRCLVTVLPHRFARIQADEPILHVDQVVRWLSRQVEHASLKGASLGNRDQDRRVISDMHAKLVAGVDFAAVRTLAHGLTRRLLDVEPLRSQVQSRKFRTSPGEWAYYAVIWAIAGLKQQRLLGKDWIKRDLVQGSLGFAMGGGGAKDGDDDGEDDDTDDDDNALEDLPPTHIALFHDIGRVIAQRAAQLPWVAASSSGVRTLSRGAKRNKKQLSMRVGDGEEEGQDAQTALILKKGDEVKYIKHLADFGIVEGEGEGDAAAAAALQAAMSTSARKDVEEARAAEQAASHAGADVQHDVGGDGTSLHTRQVALARAASYLVDSSPTQERVSYTASHFPPLARAPALIDTLSSEAVDALLFAPGEMEGYLREEAEVALLRRVREQRGDWDVPRRDGACVEGPSRSRGEKRSRTGEDEGAKEEEEEEEVAYLYDADEAGGGVVAPSTGAGRAGRGKKLTRTKATPALLAAARGELPRVSAGAGAGAGDAGQGGQEGEAWLGVGVGEEGPGGAGGDEEEEDEEEWYPSQEHEARDEYGLGMARGYDDEGEGGGGGTEDYGYGHGYDDD